MVENLNAPDLRDQLSERELTILRLMADGLSNQEIADRLFLALTTIKWYIRQINDKLDTHSRTQTVARAHQLKLIGESDTARVAAVEASEPPENPYKGLHPFRETDAQDFFGREALVAQLLQRLSEQQRFLAVIGPSGSGKSSVVSAGLVPAVRQGKLPGSERWLVATLFPGAYPLEELEAALLRIAVNPPESLINQLREDERGLLRAVKRILPPDDRVELLLIIDQFEEVFTLVDQEAARLHFLDSLVAAARDPRSRLNVIITLRADFVDRPLLYRDCGQLIQQQHEFILPMNADELKQAIVAPAQRVGVEVETDLVAEIVREVSQQPGTLPLLQYTLTELFERRENGRLTLTDYRARGGVRRALAQRADELYERLDSAGQEVTRQLFLRLVQLGEGTEDTRRRVLRSELMAMGSIPTPLYDETDTQKRVPTHHDDLVGTPFWASAPESLYDEAARGEDEMGKIIDTFTAYRLLTLDRDAATRAPTVELAHEAIIREWGRLREWLDENRADVRFQRMLASGAKEWFSSGQDSSFLLTGSRLAQFEEWASSTGLALTSDEHAYLQASLTERERQTKVEQARQAREARLERRSRNVLRVLVVVLLLATLGAFGLTGIAQRNEAEARSLALASAAQLQLNQGNVDLAIQQAQAALQIGDNALARRILDEAAYGAATRSIFQESENFIPGALAAGKTELNFLVVAHFGRGDPFGDVMVQGMEDACAVLNVSCLWLGNWVNGFPDMAKHWDKALALNPDGIGTTIGDIEVSRGPVEQAAARGIPMVAFNIVRGLESIASLPALLYIGSDEFASGQTNARQVLAEARVDGVTIQRGVCTIQAEDHPGLVARCAGVASVFDQEGVPLDEILITDGEWETSASQIADYFAQNPGTNAIFMLGPGPASALNMYIQQAGLKPRQLYATTHDTSPEIFQMIQDGYLLQTIDQQPYMQGFQTIMSLYLYRQYGIRPSGFINTSSVIDQSNVASVIQLAEAGYR
jgi:ABC-type sugar transport system substrate-binding protein/DNA-binding CsgD family transcriptional regulator